MGAAALAFVIMAMAIGGIVAVVAVAILMMLERHALPDRDGRHALHGNDQCQHRDGEDSEHPKDHD